MKHFPICKRQKTTFNFQTFLPTQTQFEMFYLPFGINKRIIAHKMCCTRLLCVYEYIQCAYHTQINLRIIIIRWKIKKLAYASHTFPRRIDICGSLQCYLFRKLNFKAQLGLKFESNTWSCSWVIVITMDRPKTKQKKDFRRF